jgi:hypothetical protein
MLEYLFYLSYAFTITNGVIYQPFIDFLLQESSKYSFSSHIKHSTDAIESLTMCQGVVAGLFVLSFWGGWLSTLGCIMMLPNHLVGTYVSFNRICNQKDDNGKCIRDPVDVNYFNSQLILGLIDMYFISSYFSSFF